MDDPSFLAGWRRRGFTLSELDRRFKEAAAADVRLRRRETFDALKRDHALLRYKRQAWPTFVDTAILRELESAAVAVSNLIRQVPERVFGRDPARIGETFGLDPGIVELIVEPPDGAEWGLSRGDFLLTANGFKCIEFNMTSSLGGWESGLLVEILLSIEPVREFFAASRFEPRFVNTAVETLRHVIDQALEDPFFRGAGVHVRVGMQEKQDVIRDPVINRHLAEQMELALAASGVADGSIRVSDYSGLTPRDVRLYDDGLPLAGIIERHPQPSNPLAFRAFKMGGMKLYNGPLSIILSDKRNLHLLSELTEGDVFTPEEVAVIRRYLPWTRRVRAAEVTFRGEEGHLPDLLARHRADLVIKKAVSVGGKDVVLGRSTGEAEWKARCERALADGDWLAQEYQEPLTYAYQFGDDQVVEHDMVWGPFISGERYCGTILRMQPTFEGGVVNLSGHGTEGVVFEVES